MLIFIGPCHTKSALESGWQNMTDTLHNIEESCDVYGCGCEVHTMLINEYSLNMGLIVVSFSMLFFLKKKYSIEILSKGNLSYYGFQVFRE